jgi:hypothetical protein
LYLWAPKGLSTGCGKQEPTKGTPVLLYLWTLKELKKFACIFGHQKEKILVSLGTKRKKVLYLWTPKELKIWTSPAP